MSNKAPPELKSRRELDMMRASGRVVAGALAICRAMAVPGARTIEIDRAVEAFFKEHEATPLFKVQRLIRVAEETLQIAIDEMPRRKWWSEIASRMQKHVEQSGFAVVEDFVGHGIGRIMHENPQVPNYVSRDTRKHDFKLQPGLVLAVEPMVNMGTEDVKTLADHWTVVTRDGLPSIHVEHTLALTRDGVYVVTADEETLIPRG